MKKLFAFLFSIAMSFSVHAQAKKVTLPVLCDSSEAIQKVLKEYKEEQLFVGNDILHEISGMNFMIFLNKNTGSYSAFLIAPNTNIICVISSGDKGKLIYRD